jgi:multidrug resistance efflux pump
VRSEVAGRVLDLQVREGDTVDTGRLLVRIDPRDAASRRRQQEFAIAALKAEIAKAEQGVALVSAQVPAAIDAARAELAQAEGDARLAATNMERERKLVASKTDPQQALDDVSASSSRRRLWWRASRRRSRPARQQRPYVNRAFIPTTHASDP